MKYLWSVGILGLALCACAPAQDQSKSKPGLKEFSAGSRLIRANCIDCMGGSRAGMEKGIQDIELALKAGYSDQRAAYHLLLDAYGELSTYTDKDPAAQKVYAEKHSDVLKKLLALSPDDPQALQAYADSLQDPKEKAPVLARIVELNPGMTSARYELGLITARQGKPALGIRMVEDAIVRQGDPDALRNYIQGLMTLMEDVRCPMPDGTRWEKELFQAYDKAMQGAGDPAAMPDFKKRFLEAVQKQPCANASGAN